MTGRIKYTTMQSVEIDYLESFLRSLRNNYSLNDDLKKPIQAYFSDPKEKQLLSEQLVNLLKNRKLVALLSEVGIEEQKGFLGEMGTRLIYKFLPPIFSDAEFTKVIQLYFHEKDDFKWLQAISEEELASFCLSLPSPSFLEIQKPIEKEFINTIYVLAHKIAAIGIEQEVIAKLPHLDDLESPFLGLSREVTMYVERKLTATNKDTTTDFGQIKIMVSQCKSQINLLYKHKDKFGISLKMTVLIRRLEKYLSRLLQLLSWLEAKTPVSRALLTAQILQEIVYTQNTKYSLRRYVADTLQFLSFKVVENTSKTGENYIASSKKEYWKLFRKALGGGIIVAFLCGIKTTIYYQHFPIFWEAFFYTLNYSIGFIIIHLLQFTLATKQPAMTASTIAASLSNGGKNPSWLTNSTRLLTNLTRSQFISLLGNAIIAFPVAYGLSWINFWITGYHLASPQKAYKMIQELHLLDSLAIFHAGIAGIYLMISGLISGYYENKWIYSSMQERVSQNIYLKAIFKPETLTRYAHFLTKNIGSLTGNFFLGVFLGTTAAVGFTLGLPLDIRHITFSSGNFGLAAAKFGTNLPLSVIIHSLAGVAVIGLINVIVSFGLSIIIALSSRGTHWREIKQLSKSVFFQFFQNSLSFIYPVQDKFKKK